MQMCHECFMKMMLNPHLSVKTLPCVQKMSEPKLSITFPNLSPHPKPEEVGEE